jgi:hypothetical protein
MIVHPILEALLRGQLHSSGDIVALAVQQRDKRQVIQKQDIVLCRSHTSTTHGHLLPLEVQNTLMKVENAEI